MSIDTTGFSWARGALVGLITAIIPSLFMVPMFKLGVSPMPAPPSLVMAQMVTGQESLPMPVGLLFHLVYVMFWSFVFLLVLPSRSLVSALGLAGVLWLGVLFVFFPIFGWGVGGLDVSVKLIPASFAPHLLFGLALWGSARKLMPA